MTAVPEDSDVYIENTAKESTASSMLLVAILATSVVDHVSIFNFW
jgi:hypothetical protein